MQQAGELIPQGHYTGTFNASAWDPQWPMETIGAPPNSTQPYYTSLYEQMPSTWRPHARYGHPNQLHTGGTHEEDGWTASIPSAEQYQMYNMTAGSARLALGTRTKSPVGAMVETLPGRLPPAVPGGTTAIEFNDSDARQSLVYNSTGYWPSDAHC